MPLLDHFRPPLSQRRHWDSFHGAWAEAMAMHLNQSLLPDHFDLGIPLDLESTYAAACAARRIESP